MIEIKDNCFYLKAQKKLPIVSGSFHYWRIEEKLWPSIFDKIKDMGFKIIDTYCPWSVHEIKKGVFDFGEKDKNKNLDYFLTLCKEKEMFALIRPGPHINAEITYFGYPKRIFYQDEILSRSAEGTPVYLPAPPRMFPVPSYAAEKFYEEVSLFFDAICPIFKKHLYPAGSIIAVQADNEMSLFFRTSPYDHDYSKSSILLYQNFLKEKYQDINAVNKLYQKKYKKFSEVKPPYDFLAEKKEDLPFYLDWAEYKEYYLIFGVSKIAKMLKERGIATPIYHNYPTMVPRSPFNLLQMEKNIDIQGCDLYPKGENFPTIKMGAMLLSTLSRLPFVPEFSSGYFPYGGYIITLSDQKFTTPSLFMYGIKAVNFYMLVERERWFGSPITRKGKLREKYFKFYKNLLNILNKIDITSLKRKADILLLFHPEYDRLENITSLFTPLPMDTVGDIPPEIWVSEENLGFKHCIQIEYQSTFRKLYNLLTENKYFFSVGNTDLPLNKLKEYKIIFVPTFDFISKNTLNKLLCLADGPNILIIGPRAPYLDEKIKKLSTWENITPVEVHKGLYQISKNVFLLKKTNEENLKYLTSLAGLEKDLYCQDKNIETALHQGPNKDILFVANTGEEDQEVEIISDQKIKLCDVENNIKQGSRFKMKKRQVRIFEVKYVI